jgi:RNA polymerase sigma-70 factor (TIGR02943 family)
VQRIHIAFDEAALLGQAGPSEVADAGSGSEIDMAFLLAIRADMVRFAQRQLRRSDFAEDLVQDAIESALRHAKGFAGRSTLRTWMFSILKNRIADHHRQAGRMVPFSSLVEEGSDWEDHVDHLLHERGTWQTGHASSNEIGPEDALRSRQLWRQVEVCLAELPASASQAFYMKELLGLDCNEISRQLGISTGNCHVILHRVRGKLRESLLQGASYQVEGV